MNKKRIIRALLAAGLLLWACGMNAQTNSNPGLYFSMQFPNWPPLPGNPLNVQAYWLSNRVDGVAVYGYDDRDIDYSEFSQTQDFNGMEGMESNESESSPAAYGPSDLWLEVLSVDQTFHLADLLLHGTVEGDNYQILSKTNLIKSGDWDLKDILPGASGTNQTEFPSVLTGNNPQMFFKAHHANPIVNIIRDQDAIEPNSANSDPGQVGRFFVNVADLSTNLTVYYRISGSAQNGVDYVDGATLTNLSGVLNVLSSGSFLIEIDPIEDNIVEFEETVTLTLVQTNTYLIQPNEGSATITISDNFGTNVFTLVTNLDSLIGIDYHSPSNALVVSRQVAGSQNNFSLIYSDGKVLTNWSGISGLVDEIKVATVQTGGALTNAGGFTNADMFFSSGSDIGWLSADGTRSNLSWCTLTNDLVTNVLPLRGSLYVDRAGIWSNQVIGVASDGANIPSDKGVWRVNSSRQPTLVAQIFTPHLEGAITITNDVEKWGPWAGKILTGDEAIEDGFGHQRPLIYSIDTNGVVSSFALNIEPEDFDIIQTNQDLYCVNFNGSQSRVVKLSRTLLSQYAGDLLITQSGEIDFLAHPPKLFIVHWDSTNSTFVTRGIPFCGQVEHVTFAPINIPSTAIPGCN